MVLTVCRFGVVGIWFRGFSVVLLMNRLQVRLMVLKWFYSLGFFSGFWLQCLVLLQVLDFLVFLILRWFISFGFECFCCFGFVG